MDVRGQASRVRRPLNRPFLPLLLLPSLLCLGTRCDGSSASRPSHSHQDLPDRYILHRRAASDSIRDGEPQEYFDPILPPLLPDESPVCSLQLLQHDFAHTYGSPPAYGNFTPPEGCQWDRAVLEFSASCAGEQYDRIAAVWIDGVEVLRTSTAEPTEAGVFWNVRKDVTRYSSLLLPQDHHHHHSWGGHHGDKSKLRHVWVMLENIVNDVFTGVYHVNITLHFYEEEGSQDPPRARALGESWRGEGGWRSRVQKPPLIHLFGAKLPGNSWSKGDDARRQPHGGNHNGDERYDLLLSPTADLIIPVSNDKGSHEGFWFRIQKSGEVHVGNVKIPKNAYRAILEICVSFHGDDEFWYSNPPNSYIQHLPTRRGNGAFREVYATIDGLYAGSVMAFPVVYTGGFNPLFWAPVVAIGAFDLPSYGLDVTPMLSVLLKGDSHRIGLGVSYGIPFWLVNANLHLWLDPHMGSVAAGLLKHQVPPTSMSTSNKSSYLDGLFKLEAQRGAHFSGWVRSSLGNLTYTIEQQFKYRSSILFKDNGNTKEVYSKSKRKTDMKIEEGPNYYTVARLYHKSKYPIKIITATEPGRHETYIRTNLSHTMSEKAALTIGKTIYLSGQTDIQEAEGWMQVRDHSVLSGSASSLQTYKQMDNGICYGRKVSVQDGSVLDDQSSTDCRFL